MLVRRGEDRISKDRERKKIRNGSQTLGTLDISPDRLRCGGESVLCCVVGEEESTERE